VKGAYEPTDAESKCAFDGDEVWIMIDEGFFVIGIEYF